MASLGSEPSGSDVLRLDVPLTDGRLILGVTVVAIVFLGLLLYWERVCPPSVLPQGPVAVLSSGLGLCGAFFPAFAAIVADEAAGGGFLAARWLPAMVAFSLGMLALHPRLRRLALVRGYISPADFVQDRFPEVPHLTGMVRLCMGLATLVLASLQLETGAQMMAAYAEMPGRKLLFSTLLTLIGIAVHSFETKHSNVKESVGAAVVIVGMVELSYIVSDHFTWLGVLAHDDCSTGFLVQPVGRPTFHNFDFATSCPSHFKNCTSVGCVSAARPDFYKTPEHSDVFSFMLFVISWVGFALMPDMVLRQHEAMPLRVPAGCVLLPAAVGYIIFLPSIKAGIVKATFSDAWPIVQQDGTTLAVLSVDMVRVGVPVLKHIVLDALGASFVVSAINSVAVALPVVAREFSLALLPDQERVLQVPVALVMLFFSSLPAFRQLPDGVALMLGLLLQALPTFVLGLFTTVRPEPLLVGIFVGLGVETTLVFFCAAQHAGVVALIANSAAVFVLRVRGRRLLQESVHSVPLTGGPGLNKREIDSIMLDTREPSMLLISIAFAITLASAVFLRGKQGFTDLGLPCGVQAAVICSLAGFGATVLAAMTWSPYPVERSEHRGVELASMAAAPAAGLTPAARLPAAGPRPEFEAPQPVPPQVRPLSDDDLATRRKDGSPSDCVFYNIADPPGDDRAAAGTPSKIPDPFAPDEFVTPRKGPHRGSGISPSPSPAAPASPGSLRKGTASDAFGGALCTSAASDQPEAVARLLMLYVQANGDPGKLAAWTGCNEVTLRKNRPASAEDFTQHFLEGRYGGSLPPGPGDSFC